jgi:hypothetical protein
MMRVHVISVDSIMQLIEITRTAGKLFSTGPTLIDVEAREGTGTKQLVNN